MRRSLTKEERLSAGKAIESVFEKGRAASGRGLKIFYCRNELTFNRVAFSPTRKIGGSVERNKARRVMKEIFRTNKHLFMPGYDVVVVIYPGEIGYREREREFLLLCAKAGLLHEDTQ